MSKVTLTCNVTSNDGLPIFETSYQWNTAGCYTNSRFTGMDDPQCFPNVQTTQNVTDYNVNAEDAGNITCTASMEGVNYTSESFMLRISGT